MRRYVALPVVLTAIAPLVVLLLTLSAPAFATYSGDDAWSPCAGACARLNNTCYIYARRSNSIWYRTTDGTYWGGWVNKPGGTTYSFPAAANGVTSSNVRYISVFARGTNNRCFVSRTTDGTNYSTWLDIGGDIDTAPSAAFHNGYMYVFVRGRNTKEIYYSRSADGATNWSTWVNLGGYSTTAPVAVTIGDTLYVYTRGNGYMLHERRTTNGTTWTPWNTVHSFTLNMPSSQTDFALACDVGYCVIGNEGSNWSYYCYPEVDTTNATVMKFQMNYDHDWNNGNPTYYYVPRAHVQNCIDLGAKVIIFRTADTKCNASQVYHWMRNMRFPDFNESIESFIANRPGTQFWIEVGNEPDRAGMDRWSARWQYLDTAINTIPTFRYLSNCKWMASLPTARPNGNNVDWSYMAVFFATDSHGSVQDRYDGLGTHSYGDNDLTFNEPTNPLGETYYALARLPLGKVVWVTEAGINNHDPWGTKGIKYRNMMYKLPSLVRGVTFFVLTRDNNEPRWMYHPYHYAVDIEYDTLNVVSGRPCASALGAR